MVKPFDRDTALSLVRQAREDDEHHEGSIARTRDHLRALADQLEAAVTERRELSAQTVWALIRVADVSNERDAARAEVERLRARLAVLEPVLVAADDFLGCSVIDEDEYRAPLEKAVDAALASEEGKP